MTWLLVAVGLGCCAGPSETPVAASRGQLSMWSRTVPESSTSADPWLAYDKVQHMTFSFLWTLGSQYTLEQKVGWRRGRALPVAVGTTVVVGMAKELYDWKVGPRRRFSYRDLVADGLGIVLAVGFILL
ncbi:MAG: hypothetical protein Q9M35_04805 [Rhodothermus sp.]|nr:hypothetical protein [Rhodothermus sp.]